MRIPFRLVLVALLLVAREAQAAGGGADPGCVYGATSSIRLHSRTDLQFSPEILDFYRESSPRDIETEHQILCLSEYGLKPDAKRHSRCLAGKRERGRAIAWLAESGEWLAAGNRSSPIYHRVVRARKDLPRKILDQEHREHATLTPGCPLWLRDSTDQEILDNWPDPDIRLRMETVRDSVDVEFEGSLDNPWGSLRPEHLQLPDLPGEQP